LYPSAGSLQVKSFHPWREHPIGGKMVLAFTSERKRLERRKSMPTKIENLPSKPLIDRIAEFTKKLPDGEGWTVAEVALKHGASATQVTRLAAKMGIKMENKWFFVNPKTRQKYANKN
jgi:hypothetical protein